LDDVKFGDYSIKIGYNAITMIAKDISFTFEEYFITSYRKKFWFISYGKEIKVKELTRIGKIREIYYKKEIEYQKEKEYKSMINSLPDNHKKNITRKQKFESLDL